MERDYYRDEQAFWDLQGEAPYSVLSTSDQARLSRWIGWRGGGAVLDLGGGSGAVGVMLGEQPNTWVVCLDISFGMLVHARGARIQGDALHLPFAENSFSLVTAAALFHHLPGYEEALLAECYRVLRPGGRVVGYDPNARCIQNRPFMQGGPLRLRVFSPDERPIEPALLEKAAHQQGFDKLAWFPFSFSYKKLTAFEFIQRFMLRPLARGRLKPFLDRWFFWDAGKPKGV